MRIEAYTSLVDAQTHASARWELYRLLGEPVRLQLLALAGEDELTMGELAELVRESQPNVSKHVAVLRRAGLVHVRKQGTRVLVHAESTGHDAVVADALQAGRSLATEDGSLGRVAEIVRRRDEPGRAFFDRGATALEPERLPPELPAYLAAIAPLLPHRSLAIDAGTGDGRLLDVLAPLFDRVIAVDRSEPQLALATRRVNARGYTNVEVMLGDVHDAALRKRVRKLEGADVLFASRMLHHAGKPAKALAAMAELVRPGGAVVVIDYQAHEDEGLREQQADVWLGFEAAELKRLALQAGLEKPEVRALPALLHRDARTPDAHIPWQVLTAHKAR